MSRVLVTGATGYIGRPTLEPLRARGFDVHASSRCPPASDDPAVHWHEADLLGPGAARALIASVRPTHLLHLAWTTEHGHFWDAPENYEWLARSVELIDAFALSGGRRVVVAGTCAEYDPGAGRCIENLTPTAPATIYGLAKDTLRRFVEVGGRTRSLSWAWARLFLSYGPGEKPGRLVPSVVRSLLSGEPAKCSEGQQVRDFMHVSDVAAALVALVDSSAEGPINVASGEPRTVASVVQAIAGLLGRPELVALGAVPAREDEPATLVADVRRLSDEVGFRPAYDLESGVSSAIEYWREFGEARS